MLLSLIILQWACPCPWGRGMKGRPYGDVEVAEIRGPFHIL